jgi:hypothetical protein
MFSTSPTGSKMGGTHLAPEFPCFTKSHKVYFLRPADFRVSFHVSFVDSHFILERMRHRIATKWSLLTLKMSLHR